MGVVSMVYGAFAAMAQKDFKRLVAYSSVSHMGYVLLGIGVCSATAGNIYNTDAWQMGVSGAMFQMIAHGISSAGMFFLVGVVYDRVHHRDLDRFGGLFQHMPTYAGISLVIFFAALGLPGLCGFIGEVLVVLCGLEVQHRAGGDSAAGGDPDRRLYPLDDPAGLPGAGIQGPARRGPAADDAPRDCHRRAAGGDGRAAGRLSRPRCLNYTDATIGGWSSNSVRRRLSRP